MELHIPAITIKLPLASSLKLVGLCAVAITLALCAARDGAQSAGTNSITAPDTGAGVGTLTSLALDAKGIPVLSYRDISLLGVNILRCTDANCMNSEGFSGAGHATSSSLELDRNGMPVMAFFAYVMDDLGVLTCANFNCVAGVPDSTGAVGSDNSLELDSNNFPVISYYDFTNGNLKLAHCNDTRCLGNNESLESPDTGGNVGPFTSLALDALGYPVVSYFDGSNTTLKLLHCNDVNCAGGDESIQSPEPATSVGSFTSLALDAAGRPVISYYDNGNGRLKVMHCNDANCAGGGESIQTPDLSGFNGTYTSLALDPAGRPVISYYDSTNADLKVMHCNDVNCASGGESIQSPDTAGSVGQHTSLALDPAGNPVVSYYDATNEDLKLLHCGTPTCANNLGVQEIRATSLTTGWPASPMGGVCYNVDPTDTGDATFVVCDNETGAGADTSPRCTKDASAECTDDDPSVGSISVAVLTGTYDLTINSAPGHLPDTHLKSCNVSGGVDAKCSFTHTPKTRPWFPWDVTGDGAVSGFDIFEVIGKFGQTE